MPKQLRKTSELISSRSSTRGSQPTPASRAPRRKAPTWRSSSGAFTAADCRAGIRRKSHPNTLESVSSFVTYCVARRVWGSRCFFLRHLRNRGNPNRGDLGFI